MKNNSVKLKVKSVINYLSSIVTWAIFVILALCIAALLYYYVSSRIAISKGGKGPAFSLYTIVSPSMRPTIDVYDIIINTRVDSPSDVKVGDIITFKSTSSLTLNMTITHRVKDIQIVNGEYQYITQGDNNVAQDGAPALYHNIIGKAVLKLPQLGKIQFFVASKFGWLVVVILPALYIIIKDIAKLARLNKAKKLADEANKKLIESDNLKAEERKDINES
ncbi:MAG: signal peptidase I [Bacilli bacterium]|nr:signal peptidase I [Bacilli bacterium]